MRKDITFATRVLSASFNESTCRWRIELNNGERLACRYLITAVGCLSDYEIRSFKGLERFTGQWFHTARWPQEDVDFAGQRVGVIGTGSTGIQAIPVIAETVKDQRTRELLIPRDHPIGTKRPPLDTNYFETCNRDNVTLLDIRSAPIVQITEQSLCTTTDEYELDMSVFATGFDLNVIEASPAAEEEWTKHIEEVAAPSLMTKIDSWYMGSNVPGKPRRFVSYLGGVGTYRDIREKVANDGYRGFALTKAG